MKTNIIEKTPILLSAFGALILILSIAYDYGFYLGIGVKFSEMPTTLSDHLRSSLNWAPIALISMFILYIFEMFNQRIEQGMTEEEIIQTSPNPKFTAWFRKSPIYLIAALALFPFVALYFDIDLPLPMWLLTAIFLWSVLHSFIFSHERILENYTYESYLISRWFPIIICIQVFQGAIAANYIKSGSGIEYILDSKDKQYTGIIARSYEKYFMLWNTQTNEVQLISADEIISISSKKKKGDENLTR